VKPELRAVPTMSTSSQATLSIGDLARRTGLTAATLRVWETRYGFPVPQRRDSGHRRYHDDDVTRILDVVRRREAGTRLDVAIEQALAAEQPVAHSTSQQSVFAELRRAYPTLVPHRLRKSSLLGLSWAIEDEYASRAQMGHLFGAFQRVEFYEQARPRWEEFSRGSTCAFVFADFPSTAGGRPNVVALEPASAMRREWVVISDSPGLPVALAAWEVPGQQHKKDADRYFEAVWTVDPSAVRQASRVAAAVAARAGAPDAEASLDALQEEADVASLDLAAAQSLFNRIVAYNDTPPPR